MLLLIFDATNKKLYSVKIGIDVTSILYISLIDLIFKNQD